MSGAKIKLLEWHNFDAWTHWAEGACGTYHVEERNGYWQVELRVGSLVHGVTETDGTTPPDLAAAKAAAQADYEARIRAALEPDAGVVAELVEFIGDFGAAKIEALRYDRGRSSPEDDPDPVVEAEQVWNWQEEARAILAKLGAQ